MIPPLPSRLRPLLPLVLFAALALPAVANSGAREDADAIYGDYMSPYCPGLLLRDCRSPAATDLRGRVFEELRAGAPVAAIRERLEKEFGERILAAPPPHGFGLLAWGTPFVLLALASAATLSWIRRHRGRESPAAPQVFDPELRRRLLDELSSDGRG
jgi:cytochrome c-type biogenesis protein CcmH